MKDLVGSSRGSEECVILPAGATECVAKLRDRTHDMFCRQRFYSVHKHGYSGKLSAGLNNTEVMELR